MRISDWSSDVCSSDLSAAHACERAEAHDPLPARRRRALRRSAPTACWPQPVGIVAASGHHARAENRCHTPSGAEHLLSDQRRSEERRVGKECVSQGRSRWSRDHKKKNKYYEQKK